MSYCEPHYGLTDAGLLTKASTAINTRYNVITNVAIQCYKIHPRRIGYIVQSCRPVVTFMTATPPFALLPSIETIISSKFECNSVLAVLLLILHNTRRPRGIALHVVEGI